tara:strand:- start:33425 stop:34564 length:1140 start_codon:yes stop_codon:yes gene_type:complete
MVAMFVCVFATTVSVGQVATSAYFMDQRLINPAVTTSRSVFGLSLQLKKQTETDHVLDLVDSSIDVSTTVETVDINNSFQAGPFNCEVNLAPQSGLKVTDTVSVAQSALGSKSFSSKVSFVPIQLAMGYRSSSDIKYGIKLLYTSFNLSDLSMYSYGTSSATITVDYDGLFSGNFLVFAPGILYEIKNTGISFGYVADIYQFDQKQSSNSMQTQKTSSMSMTTNENTNSQDKVTVKKDILGVGYFQKIGQNKSIRLDLSFEKMPPISRSDYFTNGELSRVVAELNLSIFRLGIESTLKKGFYVDPYNLVPFLYNQGKSFNESVSEISFFGGFKTQKGHGLGAFYSASSATVQERSESFESFQKIERKSSKINLSYSYVY